MKNYSSKFKIFVFLSLFSIQFSLFTSSAKALDSSPSAEVKVKLEALKQEIASKAAKLKAEVNKKLTNRAYIGVTKQKSKTSITIATKTGAKIVSVNQDTGYLDTSPAKKGYKAVTGLDGIKEESNLVALGDIDDTSVLNARKVIILPPITNHELKTQFWGQIIAISDNLITIKSKEGKNVAISQDKDTKVSAKLKDNQIIIVSGLMGKNEILEAKLIHIISQLSNTPAATKSASPSAIQNKKN